LFAIETNMTIAPGTSSSRRVADNYRAIEMPPTARKLVELALGFSEETVARMERAGSDPLVPLVYAPMGRTINTCPVLTSEMYVLAT
jgi:hypothetical protein